METLMDNIRATRVAPSSFMNEVDMCEPQHCDSPREILQKYARGIPVFGYQGSFESDDHDEDQMLESCILDDDFDRREYVKEIKSYPPKMTIGEQSVSPKVENPSEEKSAE